MLCFKGGARLLLSLALLVMFITAAACSGPAQLSPSASTSGQATGKAPAPSDNMPAPAVTEQPAPSAATENTADNMTPSIRILQVHFRGTLEPQGCCNNQLYERDEYVAVQNAGETPQNMAGWKLVNETKGYAAFVFPDHYPCIAFTPYVKDKYVANIFNYVYNGPQSLEQLYTYSQSMQIKEESPIPVPSEVDWSSCQTPDPLDEEPMRPLKGQQPGYAYPCILYPGQIVLVFTDEIHCRYGGLSFRYALGNLWNNETADVAVLYDPTGKEVSRRSYTPGR